MQGEERIKRQRRLAGRGHGATGRVGTGNLQGATPLCLPAALPEGSGRRFKFPVRLGPSCLGLHPAVDTSGSQAQPEFWPSSEGCGPQSALPGVPVSRT